MQKIISVLVIVGVLFTIVSSTVANPVSTAPMELEEMGCVIGGEDCIAGGVLTYAACREFGGGFWFCLALGVGAGIVCAVL